MTARTSVYTCLLSLAVLPACVGLVVDSTAEAPDAGVTAHEGTLTITSPLQVDRAAAMPGELLRAKVTYTWKGTASLLVRKVVITARPSGGAQAGAPVLSFSPSVGESTLVTGSTIAIDAALALDPATPAGAWEVYSSYQDEDGGWQNGPGVLVSVIAPHPDAEAPGLDASSPGRPDAEARPGFDAASPDLDASAPALDAAAPGQDASDPGPDASAPGPDAGIALSRRWLATSGNKIVHADGTVWAGRGMNLPDTRGCDACAFNAPNVGEVLRRIDEAVDVWHASFLRLDLASFASAGGRTQWQQVTQDAEYLADVQAIVDHVGTKQDVYILLSLWVDPTFSAAGWPTTATIDTWRLLAATFRDTPHVLYGLSNEPQANYNGSQDAACWAAMNSTAAAIREVEDAYGTPHHVIAVQGTRSWARVLDYYLAHPITAGGGGNIAYETHVYDPTSSFQARFVDPSESLPVIIGEFGPVDWAGMALQDCDNLMASADSLQVPWLAWTFHMRCPPNLLQDSSNGSCGVDMALVPTAWGQLVKDRLAVPASP
ncbi:MAG: cellulase family glycosylhydrolase [Deltaproteobacteria bacterium]|nr:cellulase family glycosylhydrolase [Deltaproteobacteria bacterium]